ncbi:MAG: flagellar motor switch protein FliM [Deltaproteobacteria bacterium]|nr:flagellar motor switch protein FliM [Deltaproteobacteria bacterium]
MADRVLSQEEVDALLRGVSSGAIETEQDKTEDKSGIRGYDLTNQERIVRGRMPTLEVINERFCRLFRISLFNMLRKVADVTIDSLKIMKYGEFLRNVPIPSSFNLFNLSPFKGLSLVVLDANLVFLVVDNYFGGGGKYHVRVEGREFTSLENRVVRKVLDLIFNDMKAAWQSTHPVDFVYSRSEVNPQFANIVAPTDIVIATGFTIELETAQSKMYICYPYLTLEPVKEKLCGGLQSDRDDIDRRWMKRFENELKKTSLNMAGEIGRANITTKDLVNLHVGDIIQLDKKPTSLFELKVEGVPKFFAKPGLSEGHYALQIVETIKKKEEEEMV